jgi:hypothetical protein
MKPQQSVFWVCAMSKDEVKHFSGFLFLSNSTSATNYPCRSSIILMQKASSRNLGSVVFGPFFLPD